MKTYFVTLLLLINSIMYSQSLKLGGYIPIHYPFTKTELKTNLKYGYGFIFSPKFSVGDFSNIGINLGYNTFKASITPQTKYKNSKVTNIKYILSPYSIYYEYDFYEIDANFNLFWGIEAGGYSIYYQYTYLGYNNIKKTSNFLNTYLGAAAYTGTTYKITNNIELYGNIKYIYLIPKKEEKYNFSSINLNLGAFYVFN